MRCRIVRIGGIRITGNRVIGLPKGVPFVNAPCALDPVVEGNSVE